MRSRWSPVPVAVERQLVEEGVRLRRHAFGVVRHTELVPIRERRDRNGLVVAEGLLDEHGDRLVRLGGEHDAVVLDRVGDVDGSVDDDARRRACRGAGPTTTISTPSGSAAVAPRVDRRGVGVSSPTSTATTRPSTGPGGVRRPSTAPARSAAGSIGATVGRVEPEVGGDLLGEVGVDFAEVGDHPLADLRG